MKAITEKQLDAALENAFKEHAAFLEWFISKTKFADRGVKYFWSRSDNPWGRISYPHINPETGAEEMSRKECETDVLIVLKTQDNEIVALHIENKLGSGKFTELQPELYRPRAEQWKGNPKYKSYTDFQTVLIAPNVFYDRNQIQVNTFDCFISHEDISDFIPIFGMAQN